MKGNIFKIIFTIFVVILIILAIYYNSNKEIKNQIFAKEFDYTDNKETIISNNLRIGIIEFDNINPILSNNKNVQDISRLIFGPLFTLTSDYKIRPALAEEYSKIDYNVYLIKLKDNIKWQDGKNFDVTDVIFTIDMLKRLGKDSVYYYNVSNISQIEQIDEYTLKITLDKEIPYYEYNLIFPIVSSKYFNEDNFMLEPTNINPVGTGKFYISNTENDSITLKKNINNWENSIIGLDTITLMLYDSLASTINAFKNDQIDLFTTSNVNIEDYLNNVQYNKKEYIGRNYNYIGLNCNNKILSNKEVRQAINSAIDKKEIAKDILGDNCIISNFPLDFGSYAYDINNTTMIPDKNVSKNLLLDAGWKYTSKRWRKTVNYRYLKIELNLIANKNKKNTVKIANQLKKHLENVGIVVNVIEATEKQYQDYINKKDYDLIILDSNYGYSPSTNKYFNENNIANYNNDEINNLLENIENVKVDTELKKIYSRINDIYNDEVPYISLFFNTNTMIYSSNLKGNINPNSYNLFYGIEGWYREYKNK